MLQLLGLVILCRSDFELLSAHSSQKENKAIRLAGAIPTRLARALVIHKGGLQTKTTNLLSDHFANYLNLRLSITTSCG